MDLQLSNPLVTFCNEAFQFPILAFELCRSLPFLVATVCCLCQAGKKIAFAGHAAFSLKSCSAVTPMTLSMIDETSSRTALNAF